MFTVFFAVIKSVDTSPNHLFCFFSCSPDTPPIWCTTLTAYQQACIYNGIDFVDNNDKIEAMFKEPSKKDLLHIAISKLKPKQRDLINAIYFEGISVNDYAAQEGVKQNAISMRLARAKNNLKKFLKKP